MAINHLVCEGPNGTLHLGTDRISQLQEDCRDRLIRSDIDTYWGCSWLRSWRGQHAQLRYVYIYTYIYTYNYPLALWVLFILKASSNNAKARSAKMRKYGSYLEFGFIKNDDGKPKCVVCLQVIANQAIKPAKL